MGLLASSPQSANGIDAHGAPSGQETGHQCDEPHDDKGQAEHERIVQDYFVSQVGHQSREREPGDCA